MNFSKRLFQVGLLAAAIPASAADGYLPAVGPAPLRFELPASVLPTAALSGATVVLPVLRTAIMPFSAPPLAVPPVAGVADVAPTSEGTNSVTTAGAPEPLIVAPVIMPGTLQTSAMEEVLPVAGALSPQMFLQYFTGRPGTNSSGVSLYMPVSFVPPAPILPPSSSAAFQTTPPARP